MNTEFWLIKLFDRVLELLRQKSKKQENLKQNSIDLVRAFEDFDIWLDKILYQFEKEVLKITQEFNLRNALRGSLYLQSRFETVRKYQNNINEYWLKNVERKIEDLLRACGLKNLNEIRFLENKEKEKIKQIIAKKDDVINSMPDKTLNELIKMSFAERDINNAKENVWKRFVGYQ